MTADAAPHVLLSELIQQQPEAFRYFDDEGGSIRETQATGSLTPTSLRVLLGGHGEPIERKGMTFYPESPGLLELDDLMEVAQNTEERMFRRMARALTYILMVDDGNGERRRATLEECNAFGASDKEMIIELVGHYSGLRSSGDEEGNA